MKKAALSIISLFVLQFLYCQETDSTISTTPGSETPTENVGAVDSVTTTTVTTVTTTTTTTTAPVGSDEATNSANTSVTKQEADQAPKERRDTRPIKERISFGLGGSFWINSRETYVEAAPSLAYRFPKALITGVGYRYIWRDQRKSSHTLRGYGPNLFARLNLIKKVYLWTEYEILKNEYLVTQIGDPSYKSSTTVDSWWAGLGYVKSLGRKGRGGLSVQILYNFLYDSDSYSPYYSPFIYRVGYYF